MPMPSTKVIALSLLAISLVGVVIAAVLINPFIGVVVPPILFGVAAIVRAVGGTPMQDGDDPGAADGRS